MANGKSFFAFLAGAAAGVALVLFAKSEKGEEIIADGKEAVRKGLDKAEEALEEGKEAIRKGLDKLEDSLEETKEHIAKKVEKEKKRHGK